MIKAQLRGECLFRFAFEHFQQQRELGDLDCLRVNIYAEDVLQLLGKNNTTVYNLMFSSENNAKRRRRGRHDSASSSVSAISNAIRTASAEQLAAQSGGESGTFSDQGELEKQLVTFADDIDNEYILSFTPSSRQFGLHTIVVQIDKAAPATITARKTYWLENTSKH